MKKTINAIKNFIVGLITALAVFMMVFTLISVTTFNRNDRHILGYRAYIVKSDSMSATDFDAGDLILVKQVEPAELQEGDIISFISQNSENFGETVTHKIRRKTTDASGAPGFVTYGTTTDTDDATVVTYPYVLGEYQFAIPKLGVFFNFLKTPQGYFVCIFTPFMLLILYQAYQSIMLFRAYKKEQNAELEAEKAKLEADRQETLRMMKELQELKAQMEQQKAQKPEEQ